MRIKDKFAFFFLSFIGIALSVYLYPYFFNSAVLEPRGLVALEERDLIYIATLLMLIIVIPVLILTFVICVRYRASNKNAEYMPNWNHDTLAEIIWWGFPCLVILLLSIVTWKSSHALDPFKQLKVSGKPVKVQVVALQWKWLFIYPEENIASLNHLQIPALTPIEFEITSDAPMNSFWVPELGGQIYAMPGMNSKLHLLAHQEGDFRGSSANLSGTGFAGMYFIVKSSSQDDFKTWVETVKASKDSLDQDAYKKIAEPSEFVTPVFYTLKDADLYNQIIMKYTMPEERLKWYEEKESQVKE